MLFGFSGGRTANSFSKVIILGRDVLRMNDLVEIIRKPIFVFRQRTEAFLRSLIFADFTRIVGMLE